MHKLPTMKILALICRMKNTLLIVLLFFALSTAQSQNEPLVLSLWENGAPGFEGKRNELEEAEDYWVKNVHNPSITVFKPENPNGSAVLIFPGGGHRLLVFNSEGVKAAKHLNTLGVTGIVLKYRLFREEGSPYAIKHTKEDAVRAMRLIRTHAAEWGIGEDRIGIMGFSAGGEVVNMLAFEDFPGDENATEMIKQKKANANFHIQIYPGPLGIPKRVSPNAIPAFLLASNKDVCCSKPIVELLEAYRKAEADVEIHLYSKGDHAFNMGDRSEFASIHNWPDRLTDWLTDHRFFE